MASLAGSGRADEAETAIEERVAQDRTWAWLYLDAADAILESEPGTARRWLERVDGVADPGEQTRFRGMAWFRLSGRTGSASDADRALELLTPAPRGPAPRGLELILATLEERAGRPEAAGDRLQALISRRPTDAMAMNNYAFLLADTLDRPTEALRHIERAIELAAERGLRPGAMASFFHTKAVAHRADSDPDAAREALRRGIELSGYTPELAIELAEVLLGQEEPEEAEAVIGRLPSNTALSADQRARLEAIRAAIR